MDKSKQWVPGAIFVMEKPDHDYYKQRCVFAGWDAFHIEDEFDFRYPFMKFEDGFVEEDWPGSFYRFVGYGGLFQCHSLL